MKNSNGLNFSGRIFIVYAFLALIGVACIIQILVLSIKYKSLYSGVDTKTTIDKTVQGWDTLPLAKNNSYTSYIFQKESSARRGDIYDENDAILASDFVLYDIALDGQSFSKAEQNKIYYKNNHKLDSLINVIANQFYKIFNNRFSYKLSDYKSMVTKSLKNKELVFIISSVKKDDSKWISKTDIDSLKKCSFFSQKYTVSGLNLTSTTIRIHPYGELAKRTIGFNENNTWYGLEGAYNTELKGKEGKQKYLKKFDINIPLANNISPKDGANIYTTINLDIQKLVHNELDKAIKKYKPKWGVVVVMEVATGEIKAISSLTLDTIKNITYETSTNYLLRQEMEPGSSFKLASVLAFLEKTPNDTAKLYPCVRHTFTKGTQIYNKEDVRHSPLGEERVLPIEAFQRSSNVGVASMVFDKYPDRKTFLNQLKKMDIITLDTTQLGIAVKPELKENDKSFETYYTSCFGTGITISLLQTLTYYNAVANNGKMVKPYIVKYIINNTDTIKKFNVEVINKQICSPYTIERAQKYLVSVIEGKKGVARSLKDSTLRIAGKTGTRDYWNEKNEKYDFSKNNISFCGYFPYDNPKYSCLVFLSATSEKSISAAKLFYSIAKNIMNIFDYDALPSISIPKNKPELVFSPVSSIYAKEFIKIMNLSSKGYDFSSQYIYKKNYEIKSFSLGNEKGALPNVLNMNAADAVQALNIAGYKVLVKGKGKVKNVEPIKNSNTVIVNLN